MKNICLLALDNAISSSVMGTMDILCQAGLTWNYFFGKDPTPYFDVQIVTIDGKPVNCFNNTKLIPHKSILDIESTDAIIVSSFSDFDTLKKYKKAESWLKENYEMGATIASVCVGSFVLAQTGLLDGKIATTHWGFAPEFIKRYPNVKLRPERLIADEERLISSGACSSYIDLSMYIIEKYCGKDIALECSKTMLHDFGRSSQSPYEVYLFNKNHGDNKIVDAQNWIEKNYFKSFNIDLIAKNSGMSLRAFERRFKEATGETPRTYIQQMRVETAKRMLETDNQTFNEITYKVGYEDSSSFRKLFQKHTGLLPKEYRRKFQPCA